MSTDIQIALDLHSAPSQWTMPKGKGKCGRDPAAGPGTCWHWWEGCPNAEKRGCYLLFQRRAAESKKTEQEDRL